MRLGVFGGSFDPPHIGHLILAAEALDQLGLDRILWVLTPYPPHKQFRQLTSAEQRLMLLNAAIEDNPAFVISRVDLDRQPPHYAVDTMRLLHRDYPQDRLVYLMGSDSLDDLPGWHQAQEFVRQCDEVGVMCRPGRVLELEELEELLPGLCERLRVLEAPLLEISSTRLREKIAGQAAYRYYFPTRVFELIEELQLYRLSELQP
jgi:nicotinate-nucleotide adenylyltransferase